MISGEAEFAFLIKVGGKAVLWLSRLECLTAVKSPLL